MKFQNVILSIELFPGVYIVTPGTITKIVRLWAKNKSICPHKYIAKERNKILTLDNTYGDCWVEEHPNIKEALLELGVEI